MMASTILGGIDELNQDESSTTTKAKEAIK